MSTVINTNLASLYAQNNLSGAQNNLAQSVMRLSSGLRINSAKDDAAGLAISQDMQSQLNGINQSVRNLNDATNMMQVADTSLATIQDMLLRMKTLAVQGYNGSLDSRQRTDLVDELQQLNAEINNTAGRTKYNGNILIANESGYASGSSSIQIYSTFAAADTANKTYGDGGGAGDIGETTDTAYVSGLSTSGARVGTYTFSVGTTTSKLALSDGSGNSQEISISSMVNGDSQTLDFANLGIKLTFTAAGTVTNTDLVTDLVGSTIGITGSNPTNQFQAGPDVSSFITYQSINVKTDNTTGDEARMQAVGDMLVTGGSLFSYAASSRLGTDTAGSSWDSAFNSMVDKIDDAVQYISERRSVIGAQINRIAYISTNLQAQSTNLQSSKSAITDTDFAAETAKLTKGQIMQQAATAMLAQANQMPNVVLSLLK